MAKKPGGKKKVQKTKPRKKNPPKPKQKPTKQLF
jgi:hypothetical protein